MQQKINSSTVVTKSDGTTPYTVQEMPQLASVMVNSNGWALDQNINGIAEWLPLVALDAKKKQSAVADLHSFLIGTQQAPYGTANATIANFIYASRYLQDKFRDGREGHHDRIVGAKDWGFSWSNWNTIWQTGDVPAPQAPPPPQQVFKVACDKKDTGKGYFEAVQTITGLDF
jgi:hypothetical protein